MWKHNKNNNVKENETPVLEEVEVWNEENENEELVASPEPVETENETPVLDESVETPVEEVVEVAQKVFESKPEKTCDVVSRSVLLKGRYYFKDDIIKVTDQNYQELKNIGALVSIEDDKAESEKKYNVVTRSIMYEWKIYEKWSTVLKWDDNYNSLVALWVILSD